MTRATPTHIRDRRVHIAAVGYYLDRVWEVPIREDADRLWLVTHEPAEKDQAREFVDAIVAHIKRTSPRMEVQIARANMWDLDSLVRAFSNLVRKEVDAGNLVSVNISTGSKLEAAAGHLAAMAWGASAYYVIATSQDRPGSKIAKGRPEGPTPAAWGFGGKIELPAYRLDRPDVDALRAMEALQRIGATGDVWKRKKKLLEKMEVSSMADQMRLNRVLERLSRDPPKVEQEGATRRRSVRLTREGALTLLLFGEPTTAGASPLSEATPRGRGTS